MGVELFFWALPPGRLPANIVSPRSRPCGLNS
jgi:hypothetical protein